MNELSCIYDMSERKIARLQELSKQWVDLENKLGTMPNDRPKTSEMIEARIELIKTDHEHMLRLHKDLKSSLDVVRREARMRWQKI